MTAENPGGPGNKHFHLVIRALVNVILDGLIVISASRSRPRPAGRKARRPQRSLKHLLSDNAPFPHTRHPTVDARAADRRKLCAVDVGSITQPEQALDCEVHSQRVLAFAAVVYEPSRDRHSPADWRAGQPAQLMRIPERSVRLRRTGSS